MSSAAKKPGEPTDSRGEAPKRPRRWRRRCAIIGVLLALLLGGVLLLRNPIARTLLPRVLGPALGLEIAVDDVTISLGGEVVVRGLTSSSPATWTPFRELRCDELRATVSYSDLLSHGVEGVQTVSLAGGVLDLDLDRPGSAEPSPPPEASAEPFVWPRRLPMVDLELEALRLRSGGNHAYLDSVRLKARHEGEGSSLQLRTNADWRLGEREGNERLVLSFSYRAGVISALTVALGESEFVQEGEFALADLSGKLKLRFRDASGELSVAGLLSGKARTEVSFASLPVGEILETALQERSPAGGCLALSLQAEVPLARPAEGRGTVSLSVTDARFESRPLPDLEFEASLEDGTVTVPGLRLSGEGVELHWEDLQGSIRSLDPEAILKSVQGTLVLESPDISSPLPDFLDDPTLLELARGASVSGRLRVEGNNLSVESLRLFSPLYQLDVTAGQVDLRTDAVAESPLLLRGELRIGDLSNLTSAVGAARQRLGGELTAAFTAEGTLAEPRATIDLQGESLQAGGVPLGSVVVASALTPSTLSVRQLKLTANGSSPLALSLAGELGFRDLTLADVSLGLVGSDLRGRAAALGEIADWLPAGTYDLSASASGPLEWPDFRLRARVEGLRSPRGATPLEVRLSKHQREIDLAVRSFHATETTTATLQVDGEVEEGFSSGDVQLLNAVVLHDGRRWETAGTAGIRFDLEGGRLLLDPPLVFSDGRARVLLALREPKPGEGLVARLEGRFPELRLPDSLARLSMKDIDVTLAASYSSTEIMAGLVPQTLELGLRARSIAPPADLFTGRLGEFRAAIDFHRLDGSRPDANLSLTFSELLIEALPGFPPLREPVSGHLRLGAKWDGEEIRLETLDGDFTGMKATGSGNAVFDADLADVVAGREISPPRDLDLQVRLQIPDLVRAREFVPGLRRSHGRLDINGGLKGSPGNLAVGAVARLEDGEFRFGDLPSLSSVQSRVALVEDALRIEDISGELGGAPLAVSGTIARIFDEPWIAVEIRGGNVLLLRTSRARLRADTSLTVVGEIGALEAKGKVEITDGRVLQRVPLFEFLRTLTRRVGDLANRTEPPGAGEAAGQKAAGLRLFGLRDAPLKDLRFDVQVASKEPIELRANVFRGWLRPEVKLLGTGEVPFIVGSIYLDDLTLSLPATKIFVESGSLRFNEKNPLFPELSLKGSTRLRGYDVTLTISGRLDNPVVVFSSSPPLPADQLMLLVTTGKDPEAEGVESDQAALITVAKYFGIDLLTKLFGSDDIDATESILDRFEFDVGRNVSRSGNETWEVRFRLTRELASDEDTLYLTGERDEFDHYNAGLRIVFRGR